MAAFTAPCAISSSRTSVVAPTAWPRQASSEEEGKYENGDVGQNTILEKTQQFFQICDIESKGFITRRDMQVRCWPTELWCVEGLIFVVYK